MPTIFHKIVNIAEFVVEEFWVHGKRHNPNGPAYRQWKSGILISEFYYIRDKLHNPNGPAIRRWDDSGKLICEEFWIRGKQFTKQEFKSKH